MVPSSYLSTLWCLLIGWLLIFWTFSEAPPPLGSQFLLTAQVPIGSCLISMLALEVSRPRSTHSDKRPSKTTTLWRPSSVTGVFAGPFSWSWNVSQKTKLSFSVLCMSSILRSDIVLTVGLQVSVGMCYHLQCMSTSPVLVCLPSLLFLSIHVLSFSWFRKCRCCLNIHVSFSLSCIVREDCNGTVYRGQESNRDLFYIYKVCWTSSFVNSAHPGTYWSTKNELRSMAFGIFYVYN